MADPQQLIATTDLAHIINDNQASCYVQIDIIMHALTAKIVCSMCIVESSTIFLRKRA